MTLEVALDVEAAGWAAVPDVEALIGRVIEQAWRRSGRGLATAEVSVLLCDDDAIRALNRDWRRIDRPTNVLSFPAAEVPGAKALLGDIAIAWETTRREAEDEGKSVADHLAHLAVHGFLHLVGYDHETDGDALAMEMLEASILADLNVADPYAGSEPAGLARS